jgi:hypothetical protein
LESALSVLSVVLHILLLLLLLASFIILLAAIHQVIFVALTNLHFVVREHLLEDLLRLGVDLGVARRSVGVGKLVRPLLLLLAALVKHVICAVGRELLVAAVNLLHLSRAHHVHAIFVEGADEGGVAI